MMKIVVEGKTLSKLTSAEEEKLRNLALLVRNDHELGTEAAVEITKWCMEQPNSRTMISFLMCSSCERDIVRVRKIWPLRIFRNKIVGSFCENPACDYLKLVPAEKSYELLSFRHMPKINLVLKDGGMSM
jgi:hypothetical protein